MKEERQVKLLLYVDVLEPLSEEELRHLARRCPDLRLEVGEDFYRPEKHDGGLFLIKEGRVRVYADLPDRQADHPGADRQRQGLVDEEVRGIAGSRRARPGVGAHRGRLHEPRRPRPLRPKNPEVSLRMMDHLAERLGSTSERMAEVAQRGLLSSGEPDPAPGGERGSGRARGRELRTAFRLHPRGAGRHDRGGASGGEPGTKGTQGGGGCGYGPVEPVRQEFEVLQRFARREP